MLISNIRILLIEDQSNFPGKGELLNSRKCRIVRNDSFVVDSNQTHLINMNSTMGIYMAACIWFMTGMVIALDLGAQPSIEILNQIESYNSATCQIIFNESYTCSGVLINNTQDRGRPLVLTAAHCIESEEDLNSIVVIFGNRKLLKAQAYDGLEWSSNAGASLLSSSTEIDFALLELNSKIPVYVSPIYLGWNQTISQPKLIYSIHSPDFEDVQYSFSIVKPSLATFDGLYHAVDFGHWKVDQWAQGITSLGSSGAPLLDSNFEIIGGLSGSTDWDNYTSDYFFRFDLAYDYFSDAARQLKAWVDPDDSGRIGHYQPTHKIRNYQFTSKVVETVKLVGGAMIAEEFSVSDRSRINGVYVSIGKMGGRPDSTITIAVSQNATELSAEEVTTSGLKPFAENYIPFITPPLVRGGFSVSVRFNAVDSSDYLAIPKTRANDLHSYFLALNSGKP
jgi:hypothetical protein